MTTFAPTAIRASELSRCPRMAAGRGIGWTHDAYDEQTRRYFARGHLYTEYVARQLRAKHGAMNVLSEVEVEWPLGTGHADLYIVPERLLVEVKSTVTPTTSSPMFEMAVEQLRIYLRFHPDAEQGALYLINPSDLSREDVFRVELTDEDRKRIDAAVHSVQLALHHDDDLPARICEKPSQARGRLCPFAGPCFEGWEEPEAEEITSPDALAAASELAAIKADERTHREALKALEESRRETQDRLGQFVPVGDSVVGGFAVKRIHKTRAPQFSEKAAQAAGFPVEALAEFMVGGSEWDEYRIKRAATAGDVDFGDAPF